MDTVTLDSSGGVGLALPGDWRLVSTDSSTGVFASDDPDGPVLVLREVPVRLTVEAWWAGVRSGRRAILVDVVDREDGFVAEHAWLDGTKSMTTCTRLVGVPGRNLVAAASVPTATIEARRDELADLLDRVTVEGVPAGSLGGG